MPLLFRPEALDGQRQSWLGGVQLIRPPGMTLLTACAIGAAGLVVAFLFVGEYTRKAHLDGVLVPVQAGLQAQLFAPSSAIGSLRPEQAVLLHYPALPSPQLGPARGRVIRVSRTPLRTEEGSGLGPANAAANAASNGGPRAGEPMYRVWVELDGQSVTAGGQAQPLVAGMEIEADVLLERRRLIDWLLAPMVGGGRA